MKRAHLKADENNGGIKAHAETATDLASDFASPEFHATLTQALACPKSISDQMDLKQLREEISRACDDVNEGNMRLPERMALAQAHTLNHLFNRLTQRAFTNLGGPWFEPYMRLALRAQAQSARTLETLATLKTPTIFAKQLNVANQQVVTNGAPPVAATPSVPGALPEPRPIVRFAKSEILTPAHEQRMDR